MFTACEMFEGETIDAIQTDDYSTAVNWLITRGGFICNEQADIIACIPWYELK